MQTIKKSHISRDRRDTSPARSLEAVIELPYRWLERVEQRRRLRALDPRARRDLGVSAADIEREAGKAFWWA